MIETKQLINDLRQAFGDGLKLPVAVWYSDSPAGEVAMLPHCMFEGLPLVEAGKTLTFTQETLHCGGGRIYCGYALPTEAVMNFVSGKEHYKKTPQGVRNCIEKMNLQLSDKPCLNFSRIDNMDSLEEVEGVVFFAGADVLSGLAAWAFFDNDSPDAVSTLFSSGCGAMVANVVAENRIGGRRTFIGMMDLSVRKFINPDELSFSIPSCRLEEMAGTLKESALWLSPAWETVKNRINNSNQL